MRGELEIEKRNCQALNERIFSYIKSKQISTVVLMGRWSYYSGGTTKPADYNLIAKDPTIEPTLSQSAQDLQWAIGNTVKRFRDIGVNVYFVEDNPQQLSNAKEILRTGKGSEAVYNSLSVSRAEHESNSAFSVNALRESQATVISLDPILCQGSICPLTRDGKFWYFDDNHLSASGALAVYPAIESALMNAAQPPMTAR